MALTAAVCAWSSLLCSFPGRSVRTDVGPEAAPEPTGAALREPRDVLLEMTRVGDTSGLVRHVVVGEDADDGLPDPDPFGEAASVGFPKRKCDEKASIRGWEDASGT